MGGREGGLIGAEMGAGEGYRETESKEVQSHVGTLPYCVDGLA